MGRRRMTPHSYTILCSLDLIIGQVIRGEELPEDDRERLRRAGEYIERILDGRITEGTNPQDVAAEVYLARKVA